MKLYNVKEINTGRVLLETNEISEARAYMAQHNDSLRKPGRSRGEPEREAFIQYNNVRDVERVNRAIESRHSDYLDGISSRVSARLVDSLNMPRSKQVMSAIRVTHNSGDELLIFAVY